MQGVLERLHVVKEDYHGKTFEGNECKKVAVISNAVVYCPSVIMHVAKWF